MATAAATTTKKTSTKTTKKSPGAQDAIALLKADHREVEGWFAEYEKARAGTKKTELIAKICKALTVHTRIEEEYFYPASRDVLDDESIVDEAVVEHASAKDLIAQLEAGQVDDDLYDAKVKWLSEVIKHHVKEEEKEYFPKVRKTDLDLKSLGAAMAARKEELMSQLARIN
ncbi:hemerythrin domain-containing protein [Phenylobacterium sp.]|uniref:hemerythrin domain-containing protein n=1 Tax=Phenylobacterium sp. TaxID=1871053 RepID=UPI002732BB01|nr:hemerythrin domain-containing protein [Phenylobacterium sp.]MDP3853782.1 hemerythrin domain-containing protein [Phenylobacterium sp.]